MSGDNNSRRRAWSGEAVLATLTLLLIPVASVTADPRVDALASVLRDITGQLERFNNLYIDKLERELSTTSAKLASLEATVRSIADRAAAWDNIQNHMTVWTDQSRTMERKLDILNRCHEKQDSWEIRLNAVDALNHKLTALDKKINAMTRLEFKVEQVSERVEEVDSTVNWVKKQMDTPEHPIITEFAGRGLLSSLVTIENKLENITQSLADGGGSGGGSSSGSGGRVSTSGDYNTYKRPRQVHGSRYRQVRPTVEPEPGITFTTGYDESGTCYLHPRDSRRLQDVSAKVDLVFDRLTDPDYDYDYFVSHLHQRPSSLTVPSGDGHNGGVNRDNSEEEPSPEHLFARFWKSLFSPFKKMKRRFRVFENQLTAVQRSCNESGSLEAYVAEVGGVVQKKLVPLDQALREEMEVTRVAVNDQSANIEKVSQAVGNTAYVSEQLLTEMTNQFQALRTNIQDRFDETRNLILQYCAGGHNPREPDYTPREDPYTPRQDPNTPREDPYTPREEPYTPREEPYTPRETPSRPTYPTTATTRAPQYAPPTPPLPTSPSSKGVTDCSDLLSQGVTHSTLFNFSPGSLYHLQQGHDFYTRYCDLETGGGGWTVIQRRGMYGPPYLNFTRDWQEYKEGFGDISREFWWGNDNIYRLLRDQDVMIRFDLWDFEDNYAYAEYLSFRIGAEMDNYRLNVFGYRGNASDSFSAHNGYLFSTYDRDNDEAPECCPCAPAYGGGWWFYSCFESNLNGDYHTDPKDNDYYRGIIWELWLGDYSLRATEMKIRPVSFSSDDTQGSPYPTPNPDPTQVVPNVPDVPELPLRHQ
ncbi:uncharacterized protein LOC121863773 isoform X6 [Homarus americanus]|uniref:uncharacterized protein LOC121863773 isoform X6 n=1 Tax=Homarus americanus TaxID=6706 RepID=UPI001C458060|nr:uncharacterized protein LOC121863773 isoform X6 [Homarus americanus]